jgi:ATP-binding cassette subfamily B protein
MEKNKNKNNLFYAFKLVWQGNKGYIIWTMVRNIYTAAFIAYLHIYVLKYILTCIEENRPFTDLVFYVGIICAGHILAHIVSAYHEYYIRKCAPLITKSMFGKVMEVSSKMEYKRFEQPDFYDKYTRALDASAKNVFEVIHKFGWFMGSSLSVIIAIHFVAGVDPMLLLFPIIPAILAVSLSTKQSKLWYNLDLDITRNNRILGYTRRVFYEKKYASEIRLFGIKNVLLKYHKDAVEKSHVITKKYRRKITAFEAITRCAFSIFCVVIPFVYISMQVSNNPNIGVGAYIAAALAAMEFIAWRINWSTWLVTDIRKESKFVKNLSDFLEMPPEKKHGEIVPEVIEKIEINNLSFTYDGADKPTLQNLTLSIKKGEKIALVGHNGAGKTTLIKLLMGLYDITDGEIKANNINIADYEPKAYRSCFGTVFQDFQVFALSIAENVLDRKPQNEKERELVINALDKAQFGETLSGLEHGIDTNVSREYDENGLVLSGGMAQKIAIARIFAKNPDVVILDEPSSALDPIAEYNMYENMMKLSENKAVIFISHRLSSARLADTIYMLEDGRIIEQGGHDELMKLNGQYSEMFNLQAQNYQESLPEEMENVINER